MLKSHVMEETHEGMHEAEGSLKPSALQWLARVLPVAR